MDAFFMFVKYFFRFCSIAKGVILALLAILLAMGVVFSYLQDISIIDGIYFVFITALTVGYGDIVPTSFLTKILSIFIAIIGMIFFGIIVAIATLSLKESIKVFYKPHN